MSVIEAAYVYVYVYVYAYVYVYVCVLCLCLRIGICMCICRVYRGIGLQRTQRLLFPVVSGILGVVREVCGVCVCSFV